MGFDSIWHWLIVLVIALLIFGTGKLTHIGSDLGKAIRGFKKGMREGDEDEADANVEAKIEAPAPSESAQAEARTQAKDASESK